MKKIYIALTMGVVELSMVHVLAASIGTGSEQVNVASA